MTVRVEIDIADTEEEHGTPSARRTALRVFAIHDGGEKHLAIEILHVGRCKTAGCWEDAIPHVLREAAQVLECSELVDPIVEARRR